MQGGATDPARLLRSSFIRRSKSSQFRTKKEYCSQSRPTGTSLTTLAGHFRPLGERCLLEAKRKAPRYPLLSTGSKSCPRPN